MFGAHDARAQGSPHAATKKVAKRNECAKGARIIAQLKRQWPQIHAVRRSGLYLLTLLTTSARALGGRAVKLSSSGDLMNRGRRKAPRKVTKENTTRDKLPILPISPRASLDSLTSTGASYLK